MDWNHDLTAVAGSGQELQHWSGFPGDEAGMLLEDPGSWYDFSEAVSRTQILQNYSSNSSSTSSPQVGTSSQFRRHTTLGLVTETSAYSPTTPDGYFDMLSPVCDGNEEMKRIPAVIRRSRRREQNRESQRRFRDRKECYTKQLEVKVKTLEETNAKLQADLERCKIDLENVDKDARMSRRRELESMNSGYDPLALGP